MRRDATSAVSARRRPALFAEIASTREPRDVTVFLLAAVLGVAVGYARGGRLTRLGSLRVRAPVAVVVAAAVQAILGGLSPWSRPPLVLASYTVVGLWLAINLRGRPRALRLAFTLLVVGWMLNVTVIALNGGMPVSRWALAHAGMGAAFAVRSGHLFKHVVAGVRTSAAWLGDVIPLRPLRAVISAGDVAMFAGIVAVIAWSMATAPHGEDDRSRGAVEADA